MEKTENTEISKNGVKNLRDSIICASKVLNHIDEVAKDCNIYYTEDKESGKNEDKKDLIIRFGILGLCSAGFGKILCDAFDKCKRKEKVLKRRLKDEEMKEIMEEVLKNNNVFPLEDINADQHKRLSQVVRGIKELIQEEKKEKNGEDIQELLLKNLQ